MRVWNMVLIVLTFVLTIFGTYLVRSGVLQSVHDFGHTGLGGYFLAFMAIVLFGGIYLIAASYQDLRTYHSLESYLSRESTFLFNNVILLALAFTTLLGTLFPLISEVFTGNKITVSQPFFNMVNIPLFLFLILLTGLCPLMGWRKASTDNLKKNFLIPLSVTVTGAVVLFAAGIREFYPLLAFVLSIFVVATISREFWTGTRARARITGDPMLKAFPMLLWNMRRRYGGFIAHLGVVIVVVGITASTAYKQESTATLNLGQVIEVGSYALRYDDMKRYQLYNRDIYAATLSVSKNGQPQGTMNAEKRHYINADEPTTEVSLRMNLLEDLYVTMPAIGRNQEITLRAAVNPLLAWIWIGSFVMLIGGVMAVIPRRRKREVESDYE